MLREREAERAPMEPARSRGLGEGVAAREDPGGHSSRERRGAIPTERFTPDGEMASRVRSDPVGSVSGFVIMVVAFVFSSFLPAPPWVWWAVLAVGVLLAVKGGVSGLDVITLGIAGFMIVVPLVTGAYWATSGSPDLEEPIPVPSGYGFVLGPNSTNVTHVYESEALLGHEKAAEKAQVEVLDYYVERLSELGWSVVSLDDGAELKAPDSDVGIRVYTFIGIPPWAAGKGTLILELSAKRCPDESGCQPAWITDVEPYNG